MQIAVKAKLIINGSYLSGTFSVYIVLFSSWFLCNDRSINGVKDMPGFRQTFNISYDRGGNESTSLCDDDLGSSVVLVSLRGASGLFKLYFFSLYPSRDS